MGAKLKAEWIERRLKGRRLRDARMERRVAGDRMQADKGNNTREEARVSGIL